MSQFNGMKKRLLIILNPKAGRGKGEKIRPKLEEELQEQGIFFEMVQTEYAGHATKLASEAVGQFDAIVAAGGDGTANEVAHGIARTGAATMGLIPVGSGNDFARAMKIPKKLPDSIAILAAGKTKKIDLGLVNGRHFPNGLGIGFDALVVRESMRIQRLRGLLIYLTAVIKSVFKYESPQMKLVLDGETRVDDRVFMVTVGNGISLGGGFILTPDAQNDDGVFDVCVFHHLTKPKIFWNLPKVFWGGHVKLKEVNMFRAREVVIQSNDPVEAHVDGELIAAENGRFHVTLLPHSLEILAPEGNT